jgi:large subunit ribosomal protein L15
MLEQHNLPNGKNTKRKRAGRGNASGSGNYSGRGMKGQRSRSGGKGGLKLRGLKMSMMGIPKARGFKSGRVKVQVVNLGDLEEAFKDGDTVNAQVLVKKDLVKSASKPVKILGSGEIKKKLTLEVNAISAGAKEAVEKAGGTLKLIAKKPPLEKKKYVPEETK